MSITYLEAIREAQARALREDDRVFIYGQDIAGKFGGAFKATGAGLAVEIATLDAVIALFISVKRGGRTKVSSASFASSVGSGNAGSSLVV